MIENETRNALAAAKGLLVNGWCQGTARDGDGNYCVMGALWEVTGSFTHLNSAHDALCAAAGIGPMAEEGQVFPIAIWNDGPERTQAEVVALFDKVLTESVVRERESVTT